VSTDAPAPTGDDPVLQVVPLGFQWPTVDPFLFCVHHDDAYPEGDERLAPRASLAGRNLGSDFEGIDGWRMYHGTTVPGFPQHPHRGFETVTIARRGLIDHADSLGAAARFGRGDVQWITAGRGLVHSEMFPLLDRDGPNPVELFQIWLNLPASHQLADPHFEMLWDADLPRVDHVDDAGRRTQVTVVAGELDGRIPPSPPPDSWASQPGTDVAIWLGAMEPGASWTLPPAAGPNTVRTLYVFEGGSVRVGGREVTTPSGVLVEPGVAVPLAAGESPAEFLVLQGRPIGEPVARYGPFVLSDRAGIEQAFEDYRRTGFGGWPWPTDDPVHGVERGRFARFPDGREVEPGVTA
jgi:redox-sensitive bicupin YhaK (pirin superfamily)